MAEDRPKKIAVVGATGYQYGSPEVRIDCFPWSRLKKITNLADYDVLILNLLNVEDPSELDADAFMDVFSVRTVLEVLSGNQHPNGAIYVLGDPRFNIVEAPPDYDDYPDFKQRYEVPFLSWTGMQFKWDDRPGDTVERKVQANSGPFKAFVDKLGRWQYSLEECRVVSWQLPSVPADFDDGYDYEQTVYVEQICSSRYGTSVVFSVSIMAEGYPNTRRAGIAKSNKTVLLTGPIYFLPES